VSVRASLRRGACPALAAPMQTGDGLLVRLATSGISIGLDQAAALCAAARRHGNSVIEVTARGSIQVRGLSPASAPAFAEAVAALGCDAGDPVPILVDPLNGLAPAPAVDAGVIADDLRQRLAAEPFVAQLSAKVSVIIDGGHTLHLDAVAADVRLRADSSRWHVSVGGDAGTARPLGWVGTVDAADAAVRLLQVIARHGRGARAKDLVFDVGLGELGAVRARSEPIGCHRLRDGGVALGIALAFGHTDAESLTALIEAAAGAGASALRTAPERTLLLIGLAPDAARQLAIEAERLGFITGRNDPRRYVAACAGAPVCASAEIPARTLAPLISDVAAPLLDGSLTLHLSGCRKGCAHPAPSALTVIGANGRCALGVDGTANSGSSTSIPTEALPAALQRIASAVAESNEGNAAERLKHLAPERISLLFGGAHHG